MGWPCGQVTTSRPAGVSSSTRSGRSLIRPAPRPAATCTARTSAPRANDLMRTGDLTIATGGPAMVKSAYSSGKPAYGVGAGNATMVIDETADIVQAARNTAISKTNDHGSGCSADGNILVDASIYDAFLQQLQAEGGYL